MHDSPRVAWSPAKASRTRLTGSELWADGVRDAEDEPGAEAVGAAGLDALGVAAGALLGADEPPGDALPFGLAPQETLSAARAMATIVNAFVRHTDGLHPNLTVVTGRLRLRPLPRHRRRPLHHPRLPVPGHPGRRRPPTGPPSHLATTDADIDRSAVIRAPGRRAAHVRVTVRAGGMASSAAGPGRCLVGA
ncbi:hypothetical protein ACIA98_13030 [Streptomyces sp. NPDC051366]|uniref:hypothetical protein n=1 Tax=Streptomyces sp. NPDC051366 TaxID=3365652 RepID=UPI00378F4805